MDYVGIIKDMWESSQIAKKNDMDLQTWFAIWKDEHPCYVKTVIPLDVNKYKNKEVRKSRSFE